MAAAQGKLHIYHPQRHLLLFEHQHPLVDPSSSSSFSSDDGDGGDGEGDGDGTFKAPAPNNMLLFVGGMFDNFLSPAYTVSLAQLLSHNSAHWRVAHIQLSSAMRGFGISSLAKDVQELSTGVKFVREHLLHTGPSASASGNGNGETFSRDPKIVLMGHSTGCQDLLSYLYLSNASTGTGNGKRAERAKIHGAILQAPVSDREGVLAEAESSPEQKAKWARCVEMARATPANQRRTTLLPMHVSSSLFGPVPLSVERFWSLASPDSPQQPGEDDLFSSDGSEEWHAKTWGKAVGADDGGVLWPLKASGKREVLVLMSGSDEHVPSHVDMPALMAKWKTATERGGGALHRASQVIEDGLHDLSGDDAAGVKAREVVMRRAVVEYLADVLGGGGVEDGVERELSRAENEVRRLQQQQQQGARGDVEVEAKM